MQVRLHSGTVFLFVAVIVIVLGVLLERTLYLLLWLGGCWNVDFVTVLAVDPMLILFDRMGFSTSPIVI